MNSSFFGEDLEERKEIIIALLVILFFGWLIYKMDWFSTESYVAELSNTASVQNDVDNSTYFTSEDAEPSLTSSPEIRQPMVQPVQKEVAKQVPVVVVEIVDTDGDGVTDNQDRCPNVIGVLENQGCLLDTDGDNTPDSADQCPTVVGTDNGCPADTDGDGVTDEQDRCPDVAGVIENAGCLTDTDADGVADIDDKCPNTAGNAKSSGCPEEAKITEAERKIIDEAISSVTFITGSSRLTRRSKRLLNNVSTVIVKNSNYNLLIRGHTDSLGDEQFNLKLSRERAQSTFDYLVSKGIARSRMKPSGFGETQPLASNKTKKGRLKNRRVELKLYLSN